MSDVGLSGVGRCPGFVVSDVGLSGVCRSTVFTLVHLLITNLSGERLRSETGRLGFDPRPGHTKERL